MTDNVTDGDELIIKRGERAMKEMLDASPAMRSQVNQYRLAKAKLHEGMCAMFDHLAAYDAAQGFSPSERCRIDRRDDLVAEIMNHDNPPLHYSGPLNELSYLMFSVLGEALDTMVTDDRCYLNPQENGQ